MVVLPSPGPAEVIMIAVRAGPGRSGGRAAPLPAREGSWASSWRTSMIAVRRVRNASARTESGSSATTSLRRRAGRLNCGTSASTGLPKWASAVRRWRMRVSERSRAMASPKPSTRATTPASSIRCSRLRVPGSGSRSEPDVAVWTVA